MKNKKIVATMLSVAVLSSGMAGLSVTEAQAATTTRCDSAKKKVEAANDKVIEQAVIQAAYKAEANVWKVYAAKYKGKKIGDKFAKKAQSYQTRADKLTPKIASYKEKVKKAQEYQKVACAAQK